MFIKLKKFEGEIIWTKHAEKKMKYYRFSRKRVLKILKNPDRTEEGIAPETIASMQITGSKKHPKEVWVMYQIEKAKGKRKKAKLKIISAWRYPGRTPEGQRPLIPTEVIEDLLKEGIIIKGY